MQKRKIEYRYFLESPTVNVCIYGVVPATVNPLYVLYH
jgi:hypothetical protein